MTTLEPLPAPQRDRTAPSVRRSVNQSINKSARETSSSPSPWLHCRPLKQQQRAALTDNGPLERSAPAVQPATRAATITRTEYAALSQTLSASHARLIAAAVSVGSAALTLEYAALGMASLGCGIIHRGLMPACAFRQVPACSRSATMRGLGKPRDRSTATHDDSCRSISAALRGRVMRELPQQQSLARPQQQRQQQRRQRQRSCQSRASAAAMAAAAGLPTLQPRCHLLPLLLLLPLQLVQRRRAPENAGWTAAPLIPRALQRLSLHLSRCCQSHYHYHRRSHCCLSQSQRRRRQSRLSLASRAQPCQPCQVDLQGLPSQP